MKHILATIAILLGMSGIANADNRYQQRSSIIYYPSGNYQVVTPVGNGMFYAWPQQRQQLIYSQTPTHINYGVPGQRWIRSGW